MTDEGRRLRRRARRGPAAGLRGGRPDAATSRATTRSTSSSSWPGSRSVVWLDPGGDRDDRAADGADGPAGPGSPASSRPTTGRRPRRAARIIRLLATRAVADDGRRPIAARVLPTALAGSTRRSAGRRASGTGSRSTASPVGHGRLRRPGRRRRRRRRQRGPRRPARDRRAAGSTWGPRRRPAPSLATVAPPAESSSASGIRYPIDD